MSLRVSKPKPYTKERVPNHVSKLSRPKLDFHTHTHSFHTNIHSTIPVIFFFLSFFRLFFFLLLLLLPFSSLLSYPFLLSFSKTKMRFLFWSYPYLILSPFCFTFSLFWSILDHPIKGGNFLPLSFKPLVSSTNFLPYFILISFFYYSLVPQLSFTLNLTYAYSYFGI